MRASPYGGWSDPRSPGSRARSVRTCQCLRPRRVVRALAMTCPTVLLSALKTASAPRSESNFRGSMAGLCVPLPTLRRRPRGRLRTARGPMWFAIPSSQWTSTTYSLPVSRRTLNLDGGIAWACAQAHQACDRCERPAGRGPTFAGPPAGTATHPEAAPGQEKPSRTRRSRVQGRASHRERGRARGAPTSRIQRLRSTATL